MCFKYKCHACKMADYDYCQEYLENYEAGRRWCEIEVETPWGSKLKRCRPCVTIVGAVVELKSLVLREPWLVTEGVAGAPEKAAWEVEEAVEGEGAGGSEDDATPDGWTKEEREKIRREAKEAVARRWGLMAAEQGGEEAK